MPCGYCALRGLLQPMLETAQENFAALGENDIYRNTKATADSGFHTERNAEYLYTHHIDGYVADNRMRQRDPRFHDVDKYKARAREERGNGWASARPSATKIFATTRTNTPVSARQESLCTATAQTSPSTVFLLFYFLF